MTRIWTKLIACSLLLYWSIFSYNSDIGSLQKLKWDQMFTVRRKTLKKKVVAIIDKTRYHLAFQNKGTKIIVVINHI